MPVREDFDCKMAPDKRSAIYEPRGAR